MYMYNLIVYVQSSCICTMYIDIKMIIAGDIIHFDNLVNILYFKVTECNGYLDMIY